MIPSKTWFSQSLAERVSWFTNFGDQFPTYAAVLGLATATGQVAKDVEDFLSIAATTVECDNYKSAIVEYRKSLTEGNIGDPQPVFPTTTFDAPPNNGAAGLFERFDKLRNQILAAPAYTPEIGSALGIVSSPSPNIIPEDVQPEIVVIPAQTDFMFSIVVSKRGESDAWTCEIRKKGGDWQSAGVFTGKSADVTVAPTTPGTPEQIDVRVQLRKSNAPYGQLSMFTTVTVNP